MLWSPTGSNRVHCRCVLLLHYSLWWKSEIKKTTMMQHGCCRSFCSCYMYQAFMSGTKVHWARLKFHRCIKIDRRHHFSLRYNLTVPACTCSKNQIYFFPYSSLNDY
jgi:hypothetical protein